MANQHLKNLFILLLATLFISTSGVLGKYIAMPTEVIVWFRSIIAMIFLLAFCRFRKIDIRIKSSKDYKPFLLSGVFMAAHWVTYFYALKLSNVALGVLSLYTFPIMIAFLEPLFLKIKFNPIYILLGLLVLLGLYIMTPEFTLENTQVKGVLFGILSALCYALRLLILKQHVSNYSGLVLMFYQTIIITVLLFPTLFFMDLSGLKTQWPYILLLGILTTSVGHSLMLHSLKFFSASTASIISSLQPIFGIILAFFFLSEIPETNTYWGGSLILLTVVIESIRKK